MKMDGTMTPASNRVRIVCISDTHNDDCTASLPDGDILIHAGDMTDDGTMEELQKAYDWISKLPHKIKIVIAGNHDLGLDRNHKGFLQESLDLFTSPAAKEAGILYINHTTEALPPLYHHHPPTTTTTTAANPSPILVYGNPHQPNFLTKPYAFTYAPAPSPTATTAWADAPRSPAVPIWVTHGPALGRLDWIPLPPLTGCAEQAGAIARARPVLTVFGHYHSGHGVEVVTWGRDADEVEGVEPLVGDGAACFLDFTAEERRFGRGEKTIFVNAAWMTLDKTGGERYQPVVLDLPLGMLDGTL